MILAPLFLTLASHGALPDEKPSVDSVITRFNEYLSTVQHYSDVWDIDYFAESMVRMKFVHKLDGPRYWCWSSADGFNPAIEVAVDGTTSYYVDDVKKQYKQSPTSIEPRKAIALPAVEANTFSFDMRDHGLVLRANPSFVTKTFETVHFGSQTVRYLFAEATRDADKGKMTVELWLDPKEWIIFRFVVRSYEDGKPNHVILGHAQQIDTAATFQSSDFQIPESRHAGYKNLGASGG